MKCPICNQPVKKVFELPEEEAERTNPTCVNEYYYHWHGYLYRILNPKTPLDGARKTAGF
jgi:hypothetical protein